MNKEVATMARRLLTQETALLLVLPGSAEIIRVAQLLADKVDKHTLIFSTLWGTSL